MVALAKKKGMQQYKVYLGFMQQIEMLPSGERLKRMGGWVGDDSVWLVG
jgi:hypothetical protein